MRIFQVIFALVNLLFPILTARAQDDPSHPATAADKARFALHAEKTFATAKNNFAAHPGNAEAAWQFGRAAYDWAEFATSNSQREDIAQQGIAACRNLIERHPDSAPGHYYLGLNLGELAQTRTLGALKIVPQMEVEFKTTLGLDPKFDYAGADRALGLLYMEAPGWPASIGSKTKAHQHLAKAAKLFPEYPENLLNLIEANLKWGDKNAALRELKTIDELWPNARKQFTGEEWATDWLDWTTRLDIVRKKATTPSKNIESPRKSSD